MNQDILRHLSIIYGQLEDLHNQFDTLSRDNTTRRNRNRSNRSNRIFMKMHTTATTIRIYLSSATYNSYVHSIFHTFIITREYQS